MKSFRMMKTTVNVMKVKFTVPGQPCGKGRPRFARVGNYVRTYTPEKTENYENLVKLEYQNQCGDVKFFEGQMLDLRIYAYYEVPKSTSKKKAELMSANIERPTKKPDFDNIVKAIADALNKVAYADDKQVVDCQIRKFYSKEPHVTVVLQEVIPNEQRT